MTDKKYPIKLCYNCDDFNSIDSKCMCRLNDSMSDGKPKNVKRDDICKLWREGNFKSTLVGEYVKRSIDCRPLSGEFPVKVIIHISNWVKNEPVDIFNNAGWGPLIFHSSGIDREKLISEHDKQLNIDSFN